MTGHPEHSAGLLGARGERLPGDVRGRSVGLGSVAVVCEAFTGVTRQLGRTCLCALGTTVAVVAFVATNGLSASARNSVLSSFNALTATTVQFQGGTSHDPLLTEAGVRRLSRLRGVAAAGLAWDIAQQQPYDVLRQPGEPASSGAQLSITAVSGSAFTAIGAVISAGRAYDYGADLHHQLVAVLGVDAARSLGIDSVRNSPAIFINGIGLTVTGIIASAQQDAEVVENVVVPPYVAGLLSNGADERVVIVRTKAGAAQLIGRQGRYALNPYQPEQIEATIPPSPTTLRAQVAKSLTDLLRLLEIAGVAVGVMSIAAITILAVNQRRAEIGLLRALGYRRLDIARLIGLEAVMIGLIGGILGTSLGMLLFVAAADHQHWTPVIPAAVILIGPALGLATGAIAGALPATLATRITPMAALRS